MWAPVTMCGRGAMMSATPRFNISKKYPHVKVLITMVGILLIFDLYYTALCIRSYYTHICTLHYTLTCHTLYTLHNIQYTHLYHNLHTIHISPLIHTHIYAYKLIIH